MKRPVTMHPGFPLLWKRAQERKRRRTEFLASLTARDGAVALVFALVLLVLVIFGGR